MSSESPHKKPDTERGRLGFDIAQARAFVAEGLTKPALQIESRGIKEETKALIEEVNAHLHRKKFPKSPVDMHALKHACNQKEIRKTVQKLKSALEAERKRHTQETKASDAASPEQVDSQIYDVYAVIAARYQLSELPPFMEMLTRRDVLLKAAAGFLFLGAAKGVYDIITAPNQKQAADALQGALRERYGIPMNVPNIPTEHAFRLGDMSGREFEVPVIIAPIEDDGYRVALLEILKREVAKYPPDFFTQVGVKSITVGHVGIDATSGRPVMGVGGNVTRDKRVGIYLATRENRTRYPRTIHHEIAHTFLNDIPLKSWIADVYDGNQTLFHAEMRMMALQTGLMTPQYFLFEDIAYTADFMMTHPHFVLTGSHPNTHMRNKIAYLKKMFERTDARLDTTYWRHLAADTVNETYWDTRKK